MNFFDLLGIIFEDKAGEISKDFFLLGESNQMLDAKLIAIENILIGDIFEIDGNFLEKKFLL